MENKIFRHLNQTLFLLLIFLVSGTTAMAQRRHPGRLTPAQQRILQYNKEQVQKALVADSVSKAKVAQFKLKAKASRKAKVLGDKKKSADYYEGSDWIGEHMYAMSWNEIEDWEKEEYDWDPERQEEEANMLRETLEENQKFIWDLAEVYAMQGGGMNGLINDMLPFFQADPSFPSSKNAIAKQDKLKQAWNTIDNLLTTNLANGTLSGKMAYDLSNQIYEMNEKILEEMRGNGPGEDYFETYQRDYANKYFGSVITSERNNCEGYYYSDNLKGTNVSASNPSTAVFGFFSPDGYDTGMGSSEYSLTSKKVGGYYMIPADRPARNPKSWYILGYNNDAGIVLNSAEEPEGIYDEVYEGIDWTDPTDPRYEELTAVTRDHHWIVISHVTDADLSKMEKDDKGRILFPAQKPGTFTHVMLYVTDVVGGDDNPSNRMELAGFYTSDNIDFSFSKKQNYLTLSEWPRKVIFGTEALKDNPDLEIVNNKVDVTFVHDNPVHAIGTELTLNSDGDFEYDFSKYHATIEANKRFPLKVGKLAMAYLSCTLRNKADGTTLEHRQAIPIYVKPGRPNVYLETMAYDGREVGEETEYTFIVNNLDPENGAYLHMEVEDYTSGKLATSMTDLALLPSDMDLDDIDENYGGEYEKTSWLKIKRNNLNVFGNSSEWQDVAASATAMAIVTLPITCIPFATASVTAGAANITVEDPYGSRAWEDVFCNYINNTSFDPTQVDGTWYTYGSGEEPRSIYEWEDNDGGLGPKIEADIKANIENPAKVDELLALERDRFTKVFNFDYPVAWGDVDIKLISDGEVIDWITKRENHFSITVGFPNYKNTSTLLLSWQDGKITREFNFSGKKAYTSNLYCFKPIVHGDDQDQLHAVTIFGNMHSKNDVRVGHFSENTAYADNKAYTWRDEDQHISHYTFMSCFLNSNGFISRGSNEYEEGGMLHAVSHSPVSISSPAGFYRSGYGSEPRILDNAVVYDLRYDIPTARLAVLSEDGEELENCDVRYAYTVEKLSQNGKQLGNTTEDPLFVKPTSPVMHADGTNMYAMLLAQSKEPDEIYNLMVEVNASGYVSQVFCEAVNGQEFRRCVETGDIYTCVLKKYRTSDRNSGGSGYYAQELYVRDKEAPAFADSVRHFNLNKVRSMDYVGDGSSNIDILLRASSTADSKINTYVLAPFNLLPGQHTYKWTEPLEGFMQAMDVAEDELGRPISWPTEDTGFKYNYKLLTCDSQWLLPDLVEGQEKPDGYWLVLWDGKRTWENGSPHTTINMKANSENNYHSLAWAIRGFNYAKDQSAEIVGDAMDCLDMKAEDMSLGDKKGDLGFLSTFLDGFTNLNLNGPNCLPFSMNLTHEDDHFNLHGQFEFNMLDAIPVYGAFSQAQKFGKSFAEFHKDYLNTKREFVSERKMKAMKVAQGLNAFVGFKGYFDAGLYHSDDFTTWKPYFNDLAVRLEASVSARTPELPLKFASVGMSLQAAMYAQFMMANPADDDPLLGDRNPLSHFNLYYTMGAGIDMAAWAEAGVDLGFISASAGIRGTAGASMEFTVMSRPWYKSDSFQSGMRFNVNASLAAYARAKFLFWETSYEKTFFSVDKTVYWPNDGRPEGGNPYLFDPNLKDGGGGDFAKACVIRPAFTNYAKRFSAPALKAQTVLGGIDAYSNPTYFGNDGKIAYFSLNAPNDVMDDRVVIKSGSDVTGADKDDRTALSFSTATAPGTDKSIIAIQRLKSNTQDVDANNMSDENKQNVGTSTEIYVATNGAQWDAHRAISDSGVTNMNPKAAMDANGNWAVVWPAGEMKFQQTENGNEPYIEGDLMMYSEGEYSTFNNISLALLDKESQINDYAVGISNSMPFVWATIPEENKEGKVIPNVYGILNDNGIVRQMSLGIRGSNHQIIQLTNGRFIAASKEVTDSAGIDVTLYEGSVEDSNIKIKKLGSLGLNKYNVTNYKLFASRKGAQSASDLYVVWSQHDIEVLDAQTLDATSSNNCYVAQVTTANGLNISYPTKLCSLQDEETVINIDAFASDNNEVTALLCVTGAGTKASTGAYVLEIDSKIDNAVAAVEANLEHTITKGSAADIRLTVLNEGHDPITSLEADINGVKATAPVNIKPGDEGAISVSMPAGADLTRTLVYSVNATFTNADSGNTEQRDCGDAFSLEIADIAADVLYNQLDTVSAKSIVMTTVKNLTPGKFREGYTVKAGIYLDSNGHNLFPGTEAVEITTMDFLKAGSNTIPVTFRVPSRKEETMAYLIVQTVTDDGIVVQDQQKGNNLVALNIEACNSDIATEQIEHLISAEDFENPLLKVRNDGNAIVISDIDRNHDVKVYGAGGSLIHWVKPESDTVRIANVQRGVLLISNGTRAGKILH